MSEYDLFRLFCLGSLVVSVLLGWAVFRYAEYGCVLCCRRRKP